MSSEDDFDDDEDVKDFSKEAKVEIETKGDAFYKDKANIYFCPYCARKKDSYRYNELLKHANDAAKGKKDAKYRGRHHALAELLRSQPPARLPSNPATAIQQQAPVVLQGEQYSYPWRALVCNIATKYYEDPNNGTSQEAGPARQQLLSHFNRPNEKNQPETDFHVEDVFMVYNHKGQTDMAVVQFGKRMEGWDHACTFERSFQGRRHGREDWERGRRDREMYAWLLTKEHIDNGINSRSWPPALKSYFTKPVNRETKSMAQALQEETEWQNQQREALERQRERERMEAERKNQELQRALNEVEPELMRVRMESDKLVEQLETAEAWAHEKDMQRQKEIEALKSQNALETEKAMGRSAEKKRELEEIHRRKLEDFMKQKVELERQSQLQHATAEEKERENDRVRREMRALQKKIHQAEVQAAARDELARKQQEEMVKKEKEYQSRNMDQIQKHDRERELLLEEQLKDAAEKLEETKRMKQEEKEDLDEEIAVQRDTINQYVTRDREMNDELDAARKEAAKFLKVDSIAELANFFPEGATRLGTHQSGSLDSSKWTPAFKKKFGDEWEIKGAMALSKYGDLVYDVQAVYFKVVVDVNGNSKYMPSLEQDTIKEIRNKFGMEAMEDFLRAITEQLDCAASASYPVDMAWNLERNRRATITEVVQFAKTCCDVLDEKMKDLMSHIPPEGKRKSTRRNAR